MTKNNQTKPKQKTKKNYKPHKLNNHTKKNTKLTDKANNYTTHRLRIIHETKLQIQGLKTATKNNELQKTQTTNNHTKQRTTKNTQYKRITIYTAGCSICTR